MKPYNISIYRGDSRTLKVIVVDGTGSVIDITGAAAKFSVKEKTGDAGYKIQKNSATPSEISLTDSTNGIFEVYLVPADTENLSPKDYQYDIQLTTAAGKVYTIARGTLGVKEDITRP